MVSERRFLKEVFGSGTECPLFTDLAAAIERGDPAAARHAAACPHCAAELNLYAEFMAVDTAIADSDVRWIVRRLTNPARPRRAKLLSWIDSLFHPRSLLAGAAAFATVVVAIGIGVELRGPGRVRPVSDSAERAQAVETIAPKGSLAGMPVELKWTAIPGAVRYNLRLMEVDRTVLWQQSAASSPLAIPAAIQKLALPGKRLLWTVEALDAGGRVLASGTQDFRRQLK